MAHSLIIKRKRDSRHRHHKSALSNQSKRDALFRKRYIKLLSATTQPQIVKDLLQKAPIPVLKLICNAAIHASHGQVRLSNKETELFRKKKSILGKLVNKNVPFPEKRHTLVQRGGAFPLIPTLLTAVLSSVGPLLFERLIGNNHSPQN